MHTCALAHARSLPENVADVWQVSRPKLLGHRHQHNAGIITHTLLPVAEQVGNALKVIT
jgi:hypothetical protein